MMQFDELDEASKELFGVLDKKYTVTFQKLPQQTDKVQIGQAGTCRFCGKSEPEVSFSNISHAIPESIGNKSLIGLDECDSCNTFFSENVEVHYDKVVHAYRQIAKIKGKKKIPSHKDGNFRIDVNESFEMLVPEGSDSVKIDEEKKVITINYKIGKYVPVAVYKTLVKMALSIMPSHYLKFFSKAIEWINNEDHSSALCILPPVIETFIPGPCPNIGLAINQYLSKKIGDSDDCAHCLFQVCFGNIVHQVVVPSDYEIINGFSNLKIYRCPTPFDFMQSPFGDPICKNIKYSESEAVAGRVLPINFSYENKTDLDAEAIKAKIKKLNKPSS